MWYLFNVFVQIYRFKPFIGFTVKAWVRIPQFISFQPLSTWRFSLCDGAYDGHVYIRHTFLPLWVTTAHYSYRKRLHHHVFSLIFCNGWRSNLLNFSSYHITWLTWELTYVIRAKYGLRCLAKSIGK